MERDIKQEVSFTCIRYGKENFLLCKNSKEYFDRLKENDIYGSPDIKKMK